MKTSLFLLMLMTTPSLAAEPNQLSQEERSAGFTLIFDGKTFDGWTQRDGNWVVEDGAFYRAKCGRTLIFVKNRLPDDFEFRFDWKVSPGTNSGVKYRDANFEYQILDNSSKPVKLLNPRQAAGSIYFGVAPCCDRTRKPGQWNTGRIVCKGTVIQHWLGERKRFVGYTLNINPHSFWRKARCPT